MSDTVWLLIAIGEAAFSNTTFFSLLTSRLFPVANNTVLLHS